MFELNAQDTNDLLASIELGWAKEVPSASFTSTDDFGEIAEVVSFYTIDGRVFRLGYQNRTASTTFHEVHGEPLEIFQSLHGAH